MGPARHACPWRERWLQEGADLSSVQQVAQLNQEETGHRTPSLLSQRRSARAWLWHAHWAACCNRPVSPNSEAPCSAACCYSTTGHWVALADLGAQWKVASPLYPGQWCPGGPTGLHSPAGPTPPQSWLHSGGRAAVLLPRVFLGQSSPMGILWSSPSNRTAQSLQTQARCWPVEHSEPQPEVAMLLWPALPSEGQHLSLESKPVISGGG